MVLQRKSNRTMWGCSKPIMILIIIFAGWFIGISGYSGYSLLNDADFLATEPQFENPDLYGLLSISKNLFYSPIIAVLTIFPNLLNQFSIGFFPETVSLQNKNPILRC